MFVEHQSTSESKLLLMKSFTSVSLPYYIIVKITATSVVLRDTFQSALNIVSRCNCN